MMTRSRNIFMFSGQGSQYYQMGRALYDQGGVFARQMRRMDQIVQDLGGASVIGALYGDRSKSTPFDDLRVSHPAIFMVEYALARNVIELGVEPDMTMGVSLGSVAAAVIAGCLPMEAALSWVIGQASYIVERCELGGMISVLAPPHLHDVEPLRSRSVIAALNGSSHWVLSAREGDLARIEGFLQSRGVAFSRLPVRYPFHSPWIVKDRAAVSAHVRNPALARPGVPLVCCAQGGILSSFPPDYFWTTMLEPIQLARTIGILEALPAQEGARYLDFGPSGTLATLLKYLLPTNASPRIAPLLGPYGRDLANLASLGASRAPLYS
jgi:bacillaene synthase trans-acting acyltransferase